MHLAEGSVLIDGGVPVGFPFRGAKPDIDALRSMSRFVRRLARRCDDLLAFLGNSHLPSGRALTKGCSPTYRRHYDKGTIQMGDHGIDCGDDSGDYG